MSVISPASNKRRKYKGVWTPSGTSLCLFVFSSCCLSWRKRGLTLKGSCGSRGPKPESRCAFFLHTEPCLVMPCIPLIMESTNSIMSKNIVLTPNCIIFTLSFPCILIHVCIFIRQLIAAGKMGRKVMYLILKRYIFKANATLLNYQNVEMWSPHKQTICQSHQGHNKLVEPQINCKRFAVTELSNPLTLSAMTVPPGMGKGARCKALWGIRNTDWSFRNGTKYLHFFRGFMASWDDRDSGWAWSVGLWLHCSWTQDVSLISCWKSHYILPLKPIKSNIFFVNIHFSYTIWQSK